MKAAGCIFSIAFIFFSQQALAIPNGEYNCKIVPKGDDKKVVKLSFEIKKGEVKCLKEEDETCVSWFKFSPKKTDFWLDGLVDGQATDNSKGDWEVSADSDGCDNGHLTLYKDSKFTKGFITSEFSCGEGGRKKFAGTVTCE